ncbi:glycosyltransferase [Pseudogulbenkiania sp. MAI-1]|uniref:glycosyltransferase n=1 Tax=Pseudogulbenkiania sp. MAI-1 TaxID=990370 RepID=UPI0004B03B30|nr:glycosyltransferase [Pseudogulbenkiania sp. MAI-1]
MISVVIPSYNYAHFLPVAIDSVLTQEVTDIEIIVCDDLSSDDTPQVMQAYAGNGQIRYYRNEVNLGATDNINYGMTLARGEYVLLLGADDLLEPGALKRLKAVLDAHPECGFVYGRYSFLQENGAHYPLSHPGWANQSYAAVRDELPDLLRYDCYINMGTTLFRRELLAGRPFFDRSLVAVPEERFFRATDWDLVLRLAAEGVKSAFVNEPIAIFRQHASQASSGDRYALTGLAILEHALLLERYLTAENMPRVVDFLPDIVNLFIGKFEFYKAHRLKDEAGRHAFIEERVCKVINFINSLMKNSASFSSPAATANPGAHAPEGGQAAPEYRHLLRAIPKRPMFSVVIPTRNRLRHLAMALESLCRQSIQDFEVIVANDGGCAVEDVVNCYRSKLPRINSVSLGVSRGPGGARNAALQLVRGQYVAYLDDDDIFLPEHLEVLSRVFFQHPEAFVYTDAEYRTTRKNGEELVSKPYAQIPYSRDRLLVQNFIPTDTWAHPASLLDKVGGFDESLDMLEDWDFLIRLSALVPFVHEPTVTVRVFQDESREDHTLRNHRHKLRDYYHLLYQRHPVSGKELQRAREQFLLARQNKEDGTALPVEIPAESYAVWLNTHQITEIKAESHAVRMLSQWKTRPVVNLLLVVDASNLALLAATVDSLQRQLYKDWRLIVVSDLECVDPVFQQTDFLGWMQIADASDKELVCAALNAVIADIPSDWVALIPPGTVLSPEAMLKLGDYGELHPEWQVIYTDHDTTPGEDKRVEPRFKPDFNLDMLLATDYIGAAVWCRFDALSRLGGFAPEASAWLYDTVLRAADAFGDASVGHIPEVGFSFPAGYRASEEDARIYSVSRFLERNGLAAALLPGYTADSIRIDYPVPEPAPLVSCIVPTREKLEFLEPCLQSLLAKTRYHNYEIIVVDGNSEDPDLLAYYDDLRETHPGKVRILACPEPFDPVSAYRFGAAGARGEFLLFLANDTEFVQDEWLGRLLSQTTRADVGAVGPRLLTPESAQVYSAGMVLGLGGEDAVAGHAFSGEDIKSPGYMSRALLVQNYSALAGDCLLVRRTAYEEAGGLTGEMAGNPLWHVDLCLRLAEQGYRLTYTPFSNVVAHGGVGYKQSATDIETTYQELKLTQEATRRMLDRWQERLAKDAAYHRSLTLTGKGFELETRTAATWDNEIRDKPRLMGVALSGGSGIYRLIQPLGELAHQGMAHSAVLKPSGGKGVRLPTVVELERMGPDTVYFQNSIGEAELKWLEKMKDTRPQSTYICSLDDLIVQVPSQSSAYYHFQKHFRDAKPKLRRAMKLFDRLVVSTQPLADYCQGMIDDIVLLPNTLDRNLWGDLSSLRSVGRKPRVGWVGAQQHQGDLAMIFDVVKELADEVEWVFMGMCPSEIRPYVKEAITTWLPYDRYPAAVANLNLDLAIAPLEVNAFNEAKSNLRLLEYGALGWPVVCTDIYPYQTGDAPVKRVPNTTAAWVEAIRERVHDLGTCHAEGDRLRQWVDGYWLENRAGDWFDALTRKKS